ncbi:MAG: PhzF family phenazine biosynthesis protein [Pseudomonadota bacterium]
MSHNTENIAGLRWLHVDVFTHEPLSGNAVAVFPDAGALSEKAMLALTRELRIFEAIFLSDVASGHSLPARIFTAEEELVFAGHPVLGAAAGLQHLRQQADSRTWVFSLSGRDVPVAVSAGPAGYMVEMDQGVAELGPALSDSVTGPLLDCLGLDHSHLSSGLPIVIASTGLPYAIIPVGPGGLAQAEVRGDRLQGELHRHGAKFVYVLDVENFEGRSWDNLGQVEDIATGSAAGPAAAYLWHYCGAPAQLTIQQGSFTGRPSSMEVRRNPETGHVLVSGGAVILAEGRFL